MVTARKVLGLPEYNIDLNGSVIEEAATKKLSQLQKYRGTLSVEDQKILETSVLSAKKFLLQQVKRHNKEKNPVLRLWRRWVPNEKPILYSQNLFTSSFTSEGHTATHSYKEVQDQTNRLREEVFYVDGRKVSGSEYRDALQRQHRVPYSLLTGQRIDPPPFRMLE